MELLRQIAKDPVLTYGQKKRLFEVAFDIGVSVGVERCRKLILLSISRNFGNKLRYYQQQLPQFQQPKIELQSCTLSFLQSCFFSFCWYNFGNFFFYAESADISALDADDFTDVTLAKVTLLM